MEPISSRLRDDVQLDYVNNNKIMIYNSRTKQTAIVLDVFIVDPAKDRPEEWEEDRFVEYTTEEGVHKDFSVDLDDEDWIWHDELEENYA